MLCECCVCCCCYFATVTTVDCRFSVELSVSAAAIVCSRVDYLFFLLLILLNQSDIISCLNAYVSAYLFFSFCWNSGSKKAKIWNWNLCVVLFCNDNEILREQKTNLKEKRIQRQQQKRENRTWTKTTWFQKKGEKPKWLSTGQKANYVGQQ